MAIPPGYSRLFLSFSTTRTRDPSRPIRGSPRARNPCTSPPSAAAKAVGHRGLREMLELGVLGAVSGKVMICGLRCTCGFSRSMVQTSSCQVSRCSTSPVSAAVRAEDLQAGSRPWRSRCRDSRSRRFGSGTASRSCRRDRNPGRRGSFCRSPTRFSQRGDHGIDEVHAAPGHAARGSFLALWRQCSRSKRTRWTQIALHVQEFPEPPVAEHALHFLQRG